MTRCMFVINVSLLIGAGSPAFGQQATVAQLPSVSTFGTSTSVSVPDRGAVSLGGVGRASSGSTAFGPGLPGNRSFGCSVSTSTATVHATIHDFDALDRAALERGQGGRSHAAATSVEAKRLAFARQSTAGRVPPGSVADARRMRAAERTADDAEAADHLKYARDARAAGKSSVAAVFYKMAAKHASGELRRQIEQEASTLARSAESSRLAATAKRRGPPPRGAAIRP